MKLMLDVSSANCCIYLFLPAEINRLHTANSKQIDDIAFDIIALGIKKFYLMELDSRVHLLSLISLIQTFVM